MKTIKEAATERANSLCFPKNKEEFRKMIHQAFCSGAKFAQQWISVDEELPELNKAVLIKNKTGVGIGSRYSGKSFIGKGFTSSWGEVTHWRQIELK
jgi:hypothetical protein